MAARRPSRAELTFAYKLLYWLGANLSSWPLILAVVAWVRKEGGVVNRHNNPLNIRNSRFAVGYWYSRGNGRFSIFSSLDQGARASAEFLKQHAYGYPRIVAAARRSAKSDADKAEQARDFIYALGLSGWSSDHYGYGRNATRRAHMTEAELYNKSAIIPIWAALMRLSGLTLPREALPQPPPPKTPPTPKRPTYPKVPKPFDPTQVEKDYIDPYELYNWYAKRNEPTPVVEFITFLDPPQDM